VGPTTRSDEPASRSADVDQGLTHLALPVADLAVSLDFWARYAEMQVVHRRSESDGGEVAWISDLTRPFVLVLIQVRPDRRLEGTYCHLGVAVASRERVDELCELARAEGRSVFGPNDYGPPVGYWAYIADPDGHNLEISFGQEVTFTVQTAEKPQPPRGA
jgi:catechol 2,3-dioxygenase-like lactoylglutathione lyase family enzyme